MPSVFGFSFAWLLFAVLTVRVVTSSPQSMVKVGQQPVFVAVALFVAVSFWTEARHANADFSSINRFLQTATGSLLIASLCRTRASLSIALRSLAWFGCAVSLVLIATSYGKLSGVEVEEFEGASNLRGEVFANDSFFADLNRWSFLCGLGAPVALALLARSVGRQKLKWACITPICMMGAAMPLSRSGIMVMLATCGVVMLLSGGNRLKVIVVMAAMVVGVAALVPSAVIQRFKGSGALNVDEESKDSRQQILAVSLNRLPEYWLLGVGSGNYWKSWAVSTGLSGKAGRPRGAHNSFFQVLMNWGAPAFLLFVSILVFAFRCVPKNVGRDPLALCLLALAYAMTFRMLFTHSFYVKDFAAILGLLAAARPWIWPTGKAQPSRRLPPRASGFRHASRRYSGARVQRPPFPA